MGKKPMKSFRTTITVPQDLKARMDTVNEPVNWSALACRAFEAKLGEIAARKAKMTMDNQTAVERLRALKQQEEGQAFRNGVEAGIEWAKVEATPKELTRLRRWHDECDGVLEWELFFEEVRPNAPVREPYERLYFRLHPEDRSERPSAKGFWKKILGDRAHEADDPMFVRGFAEGALEWWAEWEHQL